MMNTKTSCSRLVLLALASVVTMGVLVTAKICTEGVTPCRKGFDCNTFCGQEIPGAAGVCDRRNECVCSYECPVPKRCNDGLGRCFAGCQDDCCNKKCRDKHPRAEAAGRCDNSLGPQIALCQCEYNCF